jgi:hypothetical protein
MIKLANILSEMAIFNAWSGDKSKLAQETDVVIKAAEQVGIDKSVLWRGTKGIPSKIGRSSALSRIMYITGDREAFRGGNEGAKLLMQKLKIKQPVFAFFNRDATRYFGNPCVVVPQQPYKIYQSEKIDDVMTFGKGITNQDLQSAASTYKDITDSVTALPGREMQEVIIDTANYWAIPCGNEIKTYGDLVKLLNSYKTKFT